jgi:probable biosynthetic protein (TIGR04098 family)
LSITNRPIWERFLRPLAGGLNGLHVHLRRRLHRIGMAFWVEPRFRRRCVAVGAGLRMERLPHVTGVGRIIVGDHVNLSGRSNIGFSNIAVAQPELSIGDHTFVAHGCSFHVAASVTMGRRCLLAGQVRIRDFDGHPVDAARRQANMPTPPEGIKPVRIGDDVWIGNNALILKGVTIGDRAVVAAMSVVAHDVPADTLVAGNPARAIKSLREVGGSATAGSAPPTATVIPSEDRAKAVLVSRSSVEDRVRHIVAELARMPPEEIDVARWVTHYGIDSLQLLILREMLESEFQVRFPDSVWLDLRSIRSLVDYTSRRQAGPSPMMTSRPGSVAAHGAPAVATPSQGRRYTASGMLYADLEIGMPLTGVNNLAEGPLLQWLGDLRWGHMSQLCGQPSQQIVDGDGNRLYATFFYVELAFPPARPMAAYGLNDRIKAAGDLKRFGRSMLDGAFYLLASDAVETTEPPWASMAAAVAAGVPAARLCNIFATQFGGAEWLKRSRPVGPGFDRIAEMPQAPDCSSSVKQAAENGGFPRPPQRYEPMTSGPVRVAYKLAPDRDVNGAGLVYFANYPVFLDIAEREALAAAAWPLTEELIDTRTLVRRRSAYLNNASARDSLLIEVEPWVENPFATGEKPSRLSPVRLWLNFRMYRQSDERLMMVSTAEKVLYGQTLEALPFLSELKAAARAGR